MFGLMIPPKDFQQCSIDYYFATNHLFTHYMINYYNWWTGVPQFEDWWRILTYLTQYSSQTRIWLQVGEEEILGNTWLAPYLLSASYQAPYHSVIGIMQWDECAWNIQYGNHNCAAHNHRQYTLEDYRASCRRLRATYPQVLLMDVEPVHILPYVYQQYSPEVQWFGGDAYGNDWDSYDAQYNLQRANALAIMQYHGTATPFILLKYGNGRSQSNVLGGIRGAMSGGVSNIFFWSDPSENIVAGFIGGSPPASPGWTALVGAIEGWRNDQLGPAPADIGGPGSGPRSSLSPGVAWSAR